MRNLQHFPKSDHIYWGFNKQGHRLCKFWQWINNLNDRSLLYWVPKALKKPLKSFRTVFFGVMWSYHKKRVVSERRLQYWEETRGSSTSLDRCPGTAVSQKLTLSAVEPGPTMGTSTFSIVRAAHRSIVAVAGMKAIGAPKPGGTSYGNKKRFISWPKNNNKKAMILC